MNSHYVYILASKRNGTLYVGFTSDLLGRVYAHKNDFVEGFTKKYRFIRLCIRRYVMIMVVLFSARNRLKNGKGGGR